MRYFHVIDFWKKSQIFDNHWVRGKNMFFLRNRHSLDIKYHVSFLSAWYFIIVFFQTIPLEGQKYGFLAVLNYLTWKIWCSYNLWRRKIFTKNKQHNLNYIYTLSQKIFQVFGFFNENWYHDHLPNTLFSRKLCAPEQVNSDKYLKKILITNLIDGIE